MSKNKSEIDAFKGLDLLSTDIDKAEQEQLELSSDEEVLDEEESVIEKQFKEKETKTEKKENTTKSKTEDNEKNTKEHKEEIHENVNSSEESKEDFSIKPFIEFYRDKGILDIEDDDIEDSDEGLEKAIVKTVESQINKWKSNYDEDTQKYLDFVENGGDPKQFHELYYNSGASWEKFDIEDNEDNQKKVIRESLKLEGWSDEDISEEIQDTEDINKLDVKAKKHLVKLQKLEKENREHIVKIQKEYAKEQETKHKEYWDNLKSNLFTKEDIKGFKLTEKIKNDIWNHMSKPVDRKSGKTQLQINNETNKDAQFLYAMLDYLNWDISKLEKNLKSKVSADLKSKLHNFSDSRVKSKSSGNNFGVSKDNNFDAFSSFL